MSETTHQTEIYDLRRRVSYLEDALRQIAKREGRFSRDHLEHCGNTVDAMAAIAGGALMGTWDKEALV